MTIYSTSVAMTTYPASCADDELNELVRANLGDIRRRIRATGRTLESVRIVAVTKTFGPAAVRAAAAAGLQSVGENYVQELIDKRAVTADLTLSWHFLGALQTNKVKRLAGSADVLCGVSRVKELDSIAAHGVCAALYVQIDFTGLPTRRGAPPDQAATLATRARELGLSIQGLMTVAPPDGAGARQAFQATRALADKLGIVERSMGMSDDLELACQYGTSEIRVGRALFGPRGAR